MRAASSSSLRGPVVVALALLLAGCAGHKAEITGSIPDTPETRHPIQVARGVATLDLIPGGGPAGLTDRQAADIRGFAASWVARGRGQLAIQVPIGAGATTDTQSAYAAKEIRAIAAASGVPGKAILQTRYEANGPDHLAPVRLSYPVLEARLPHECGQWPDDAGFSDPKASNLNRQQWNYGCAYQQNMAAMVDDPEDFIRPRAEDPTWAARKATVMKKYTDGERTITENPVEAENTQ